MSDPRYRLLLVDEARGETLRTFGPLPDEDLPYAGWDEIIQEINMIREHDRAQLDFESVEQALKGFKQCE